MRSKVNIKGHPIHPMLIAYPIAFATAAPLADLAGLLGDWPTFFTAGAYASIAAVVTGLLAAVPGFIDFLYVVPPKSSGKKRAIYHMIVNVVSLTLMAAGWAFRDWETLRPENLAVVLEFASIGFMTVGGWLGGTLVYRNQIAVDHRYADAGKWKEQYLEPDAQGWVTVQNANELEVDQMILTHVGSKRIVLARSDDGFVAFDDSCTHRGGSLADGTMSCGTVTCPWHGSQYDVHNGKVKAGPTERPIPTYDVDQTGGEVRIRITGRRASVSAP
jgi:nitrite reductase/ring-hydroxylating ferredoxin subunit/uncharacterized membrane protein